MAAALSSCHHPLCSTRARVLRKLFSTPFSGRLAPRSSVNVGFFLRPTTDRTQGRRSSISIVCPCQANPQIAQESAAKEDERPKFDINLAVVLAGFAFEAYSSPPENVGAREVDAADCQTIYLSEFFLREVYDGQLVIKVKQGLDLPIMDPWGTSDPYVVMQFDGQVAKSKVKWATKEPVWNEEFAFNIRNPPTNSLQVAAWDANLVTPHKRMGYTTVDLDLLCDGNVHEVLVELEGIGGGGKIQLEIRYKSFEELDVEKQQWRLPFVPEFLMNSKFGSALKMLVGSESVQARQFVESAFVQLRSLSNAGLFDGRPSPGSSKKSLKEPSTQSQQMGNHEKGSVINSSEGESSLARLQVNESSPLVEKSANGSNYSDELFWKNFADLIYQTIVQKLGLPVPEKIKWDGVELLKKVGVQSWKIAEAAYIESGLAISENMKEEDLGSDRQLPKAVQSSLLDIRKASLDLLKQTDMILGALMILAAFFSEKEKESSLPSQAESMKNEAVAGVGYSTGDSINGKEQMAVEGSILDARKAEEMRALFATAESAMEAWAMLATSLGRPSFIKSEFEKICFLDNASTDTQVAIWRDPLRRRLIVAFRGTEQTRWKDLQTDLMLAPAGLNPERLGGDFKEEVQVHTGFLRAYDSVRNKIMSLISCSIGFTEDAPDAVPRWHVFATGHSLGGALATLLALELCSSQMAKRGMISVTMYNFGSPRVGNKRFAEAYNKKVKDSWRIVNHRDIIPTVPRLMGYCHVAQPVYLAAGDLTDALANMELSEDGYEGDVIGEYTPDVLVSEFIKGEKQLVEKILQAEIDMFRSIRDGTALMQHMEDFYYITLLESVRSNYNPMASAYSDEEL